MKTDLTLWFVWSCPPTRQIMPPQTVAEASERGWGRLLTVDHFNESVSITSTVDSLVCHSLCPPATTRDIPLHTAAGLRRSVNMGGKCSTHFLLPPSLTRLMTLLMYFLGCAPPTAVRRPLTTVSVQHSVGHCGREDQSSVSEFYDCTWVRLYGL